MTLASSTTGSSGGNSSMLFTALLSSVSKSAHSISGVSVRFCGFFIMTLLVGHIEGLFIKVESLIKALLLASVREIRA